MGKSVSSFTVGLSMFWVQLTWTFGFLAIILAVNVGKLLFGGDIDSFYSAGYIASNIYMLIIGIIAIKFLPYFVENGVTRKKYFIGALFASVGLSIVIPLIIYIVNLLQQSIFAAFSFDEPDFRNVVLESDGNLIGEIIQAIIVAPYVSPASNVALSLAVFALNLFVFYIIGWMIAAAFYRLDIVGGIVFIALGAILIGVKDSMIRLALDLPLFHSFSVFGTASESWALPIVIGVIGAAIFLARVLTKRAPIKI